MKAAAEEREEEEEEEDLFRFPTADSDRQNFPFIRWVTADDRGWGGERKLASWSSSSSFSWRSVGWDQLLYISSEAREKSVKGIKRMVAVTGWRKIFMLRVLSKNMLPTKFYCIYIYMLPT